MLTGETIAIAASTVVGPLAAVFITRWNDRRAQRRERLLHIYRTLMATRRSTISPEHVAAINLIEVEFHGVQPVIDAWTAYITHLNTPSGTTTHQVTVWNEKRAELLAILLVKIAKHLGFPKGELEILHGGYAPQGWVDKEVRQQQILDYILRLSASQAILPVSVQQGAPPTNPFPPPPT